MSRSAHGLSTPTGTNWRAFSACRNEDPELHHPLGSAPRTGRSLEQEEQAKAVCAPCPVREACLKFALTHQPFGIAGGLNELERRNLGASPKTARSKAPAQPRLRCYSGRHEMTPDNVRIHHQANRIVRECKACRRERENARAAERRQAVLA